MRIYLASYKTNFAPAIGEYVLQQKAEGHNVMLLDSFAYLEDKDMQYFEPASDNFLLDSGAFTFLNTGKKKSWEQYVDDYADFIVRHNVKRFFELDIDPIVGYSKVQELRHRLEQRTGRRCIPVWHKSRGKEDFIKICKEYDYIAIGGIVTKEITKEEHKFFPWFIDTAHKHGTKIHGLGYTSMQGLSKYHFDSVDSSSWSGGCRFGQINFFNGSKMTTLKKTNKDKRMKSKALIDTHNFKEWAKFQRYALTHL